MIIRAVTLGMGAALLVACAGDMDRAEPAADMSEQAADTNMAHAHMGHVLTAWEDTPGGQGFLPTAQAEAAVAAQHAGFAASRPDDLEWMQMHVVHVVNAIDPSVEPEGPGAGYGVRQAAEGVAQHARLAADSAGASDNVKLHAGHVETSAGNVVVWSERVIVLGRQVGAAGSAGEAAPLVAEIEEITEVILVGRDADGDGQASWQENEGGLQQAAQHMQFMQEGEGLG